MARCVGHVNYAPHSGASVESGEKFTKVWKVRNDTRESWPASVELICVSTPNDFCAPAAIDVPSPSFQDGETKIRADLVAPQQPGHYEAFFRLRNKATGQRFGQRLPLFLSVVEASSGGWDMLKTEIANNNPVPAEAAAAVAAPAAAATAFAPLLPVLPADAEGQQQQPQQQQQQQQQQPFQYQNELDFLAGAQIVTPANEGVVREALVASKGNMEQVAALLKSFRF